MPKFLLILVFTIFSFSAYAGILECKTCIGRCPFLQTDRTRCVDACFGICTPEQANAALGIPLANPENCYTCMKECPHNSREAKGCDTGCTQACDIDSLRKAFIRVNELAKKCAPDAAPRGTIKRTGTAK